MDPLRPRPGGLLNLIPRNPARPEGGGLAGLPLTAMRRRRQRRQGDAIPEVTSLVPAVLHREAVHRRLLAVADIGSAVGASLVGVAVVGSHTSLRPAALLAIPAITLVCKAIGLYDRDEHLLHKTTIDEIPLLFQVATLYALIAWLGERIAVSGTLAKEQVVAIWLLLFATMVVTRAVARRAARTLAATERCLVIGDADSAARMRHKLEGAPGVKAEVVGRVPLTPTDAVGHGNGASGADGSGPGDGIPVLGGIDLLGLTLVEHDVHRAVIATDDGHSDEVLDVIRMVKALGVKVSVLPSLFEVVDSSVEVDQVHGIVLLGVRRFGLTRSSRLLKRGMDVAVSACALVFLAPLLVAIAVAVKVTSPGPALFRQRRIGRHGREFVMLKFRTMVDGADARQHELSDLNEADGLFKIADDPRVTHVGRYLRQTSLDEVPQLLNVLRGRMSLVGPRPLVPAEDRRVEGWRRRRLNVTPGMTGLWQIFGSARIPLEEMVKIDYLYGVNWSLWLDMKILLRTIPYALGRRGM
jgi:exopolysaccharide biosynthesis polyprenyl glycosylphosphotransferase